MGRADDMFSCGGENVYPKEVENLLFAHPAVRGGQQDEIHRLDETGQDPESHAFDGERRLSDQPPGGDAERNDADRCGEHPDSRGAKRVSRRLEPDIPRDVEPGTDEDERDDEGVHARTLPGADPYSQCPFAWAADRLSRAGRAA